MKDEGPMWAPGLLYWLPDSFAATVRPTADAMLLFKKRFLEAIRQGTKTQTIRLWTHRMMRAGQRSYIPGAGYIRIESVEQIGLEELTEEDAERDGFDTLAALRAEIETIYSPAEATGKKPFRIRFSLLPLEEQKKQNRDDKTA
jgi:hypothetical protein